MSAPRDFWSRRRAKVEQERADAERQAEDARAAETAARPDDEVLAELGLPDPDDLVPGDDVRAFMTRAVPQHLRNRALRKLWVSNPVLACLDGLNDYDDDYTGNGLGGGVLKTSYRVGKGLMAHIDEMERQAAVAAAAEPEGALAAQAGEDDAPIDVTLCAPDPVDMAASAMVSEPVDADVPALVQPRRMAFQFDGTTG